MGISLYKKKKKEKKRFKKKERAARKASDLHFWTRYGGC